MYTARVRLGRKTIVLGYPRPLQAHAQAMRLTRHHPRTRNRIVKDERDVDVCDVCSHSGWSKSGYRFLPGPSSAAYSRPLQLYIVRLPR
jgi:hypothetical protein